VTGQRRHVHARGWVFPTSSLLRRRLGCALSAGRTPLRRPGQQRRARRAGPGASRPQRSNVSFSGLLLLLLPSIALFPYASAADEYAADTRSALVCSVVRSKRPSFCYGRDSHAVGGTACGHCWRGSWFAFIACCLELAAVAVFCRTGLRVRPALLSYFAESVAECGHGCCFFDWMAANFLKLNDDKTELVLIGHPKRFAKIHDFELSVGSNKVPIAPVALCSL